MMQTEKSEVKKHDAMDLADIMDLYFTWFGSDVTHGRVLNQNADKNTSSHSRKGELHISNIEELTRSVLIESLSSDVPVHFALSIIESVAYTASRFAVADHLNANLYRAAALLILEEGLPLLPDSQSE
jgi:hypothetical protein